MTTRERWPGWIYRSGAEPDVRFSFANERTFLAWIRTALALLAGGVALDTVDLDLSHPVQQALAGLLVVLGLTCAVLSWVRWAMAERAMRHGGPLPSAATGVLLALGVVLVAVVLLVAGI